MPKHRQKLYVPLDATPKHLLCKYPGRRVAIWGSSCDRTAGANILSARSNKVTKQTLLPYTWEAGGASWYDKHGNATIHLWGFPFLCTGDTVLLKLPTTELCRFINSLMELIPYLPQAAGYGGQPAEKTAALTRLFYKWVARESRPRRYFKHPYKYRSLCKRVYDIKFKHDRQRFQEYNLWGNNPYPRKFSHRQFTKLFHAYHYVDFDGKNFLKVKQGEQNEPV